MYLADKIKVDITIKDEEIDEYFIDSLDAMKKATCYVIKQEYKQKLDVNYKLNIKNDKASCKLVDYENDKYEVQLSYGIFKNLYSFYTQCFAEHNSGFFSSVYYGYPWNKEDAKNLNSTMLRISLGYMILHELGHIYSGQAKYKQDNNCISDNLNKLFELYADEFATTQLVSLYCHPNNVEDLSKKLSNGFDLKNMALLTLDSVIILWSILGVGNKKLINGSNYLSLRTREYYYIKNMINIYDMLNYYNNNYVNEKLEDIEDKIIERAVVTENMVNNTLNLIFNSDDYSIINNTEQMKKDFQDLDKNLEKKYISELPKILDDYKYVDILINNI